MGKQERTYYRIIFPENLEHTAVERFVSNLGGLPQSSFFDRSGDHSAIVFEIWGNNAGIHHRVGLPFAYDHLIEQLRTHANGAHIEKDDGLPLADFTIAQEYGLSSEYIPLDIDPYRAAVSILTSLQPLDIDEVLAVQWIVVPTNKGRPRPRVKARGMGLGRVPYGRNIFTIFAALIWNIGSEFTRVFTGALSNKLNNSEEARQTHVEQKWQGHMFNAICRIGVSSPNGNAQHLHNQLLRALQSTSGQVIFNPKSLWTNERIVEAMRYGAVPTFNWPCLLNEQELSALLAFPVGKPSPRIPGLQQGGAYQAPPPPNIPIVGRIVAKSTYSGRDRPLAIPWPETLRHVYTVGATGSGKTTLLENCAVQDMEQGAGLLYLDPHGDSAERLLNFVPPSRVQDVIYFDPSNNQSVVGLNLFSNSTVNPGLAASNFIGMFKKLYHDSWGARMEAYFMTAVHTLAAVPDVTLLDVSEILTNIAFRKAILAKYPPSYELRKAWEEYEKLKPDKREERIQPILNKLLHFSLRPPIRHVVGQVHPAMEMSQVISQRKIIIANVSNGLLGDDEAELLGSLLMLALWQAIQKRPQSERAIPFYGYIDECQDFLNLPTPLGDILAKARGYGCGFTLGNQFLGQLNKNDKNMMHDVLSNTNSAVYFNINEAKEADIIAKKYPGFKPEDFQNLGQFHVITAISTGGSIRPKPAVGVTYPQPRPTGTKNTILARTLSRYAQDCIKVDDDIEKRRQTYTKRPNVGSRPI